uniref:TITAN-like protein n=1 Tax=Kalanchoe fedtschenkoi TaxID=63787 RepID=A0A7N0SXC1_KALFE
MKKRKAAATGDFEFCKVCKRHHQDGNRHQYFPKHLTSLSSFLARFQSKLSDVRFFLSNPMVLLPQHASRNRLWCVFCDSDIDEIGSTFACSSAIRHLASADHLKSLKSFCGKMEVWKRKCNLLQRGALAADEEKGAAIYGPPNDIHYQIDSLGINNSLDHSTMSTCGSNNSNDVVMPLQRYTNENNQVWVSRMDQTVSFESGYHQNGISFAFQPGMQHVSSSSGVKHNADCQYLRQIPLVPVEATGNVHTGAHPPWLELVSNEEILVQGSGAAHAKPYSQKSGKSRKLNPKRVGAAWAEKRKIEIELEKRGEISTEKPDESWLPNFSRVWQAGSRKESKKEFEMEKQKVEVVSQPEMPVDMQPYVSKRMVQSTMESVFSSQVLY